MVINDPVFAMALTFGGVIAFILIIFRKDLFGKK